MWRKSHSWEKDSAITWRPYKHTDFTQAAFVRRGFTDRPLAARMLLQIQKKRTHESDKQRCSFFNPRCDADDGIERSRTAGAVKSSSDATGAAASRTAIGTNPRAASGAKSRSSYHRDITG